MKFLNFFHVREKMTTPGLARLAKLKCQKFIPYSKNFVIINKPPSPTELKMQTVRQEKFYSL